MAFAVGHTIMNSACCSEVSRNGPFSLGSLVFDAVATITLLVVGILGATGIIPGVGSPGHWICIGLGAAIPVLDVLTIVKHRCCRKNDYQYVAIHSHYVPESVVVTAGETY